MRIIQMKKMLLFGLVFCILLALIGCQPTPNEEAVINRADGVLEKAILSKPVEPYTYEAPTRWDEVYHAREQEVRFSADIEFPEVQQFPVVTIKQRSFTSKDVLSFFHSLDNGDWSVRENEYSREELMIDLQNAAKGIYMGEDEKTGDPIWEPDEEEMKRIQKLIEQTPAKDTFVPLKAEQLLDSGIYYQVMDSTGKTWYSLADSLDLSVSRYRDGNIQMENWVMQGDATPGERPHTLENIRISEQEAIEKGNALIAALGLKDFGVADIQRARETQSYTYAVYGEGYLLTYVQTLAGAKPCFYSTYSDSEFITWSLQQGGATTYAPPWHQEYVQMFITEDGVLFYGWYQPKDIIMTANENVQLLPFSDIQKDVKKLIEYCTGGAKNSPILIKRIVLTSAIAQIPNQGDEAFLVPTWAFFTTSEENEADNIDMGVLLINALDGTYIYRSLNDDDLPDTP